MFQIKVKKKIFLLFSPFFKKHGNRLSKLLKNLSDLIFLKVTVFF